MIVPKVIFFLTTRNPHMTLFITGDIDHRCYKKSSTIGNVYTITFFFAEYSDDMSALRSVKSDLSSALVDI